MAVSSLQSASTDVPTSCMDVETVIPTTGTTLKWQRAGYGRVQGMGTSMHSFHHNLSGRCVMWLVINIEVEEVCSLVQVPQNETMRLQTRALLWVRRQCSNQQPVCDAQAAGCSMHKGGTAGLQCFQQLRRCLHSQVPLPSRQCAAIAVKRRLL